MLSKFLSRFAALHTFCELLVLSNPRLKFHKGPTFSFVVYCCTQRQSEKVNIRNACILPVRAKCGRFCVLMNGRVFGHRKLSVFRTAATVHPPYWQNGGSYPPDLTATDWLLVPANAKAGSATRSPHTTRSLAEGIIGHAWSSSTAEFSGLCPPPLSQSWGSNRNRFSHAASY